MQDTQCLPPAYPFLEALLRFSQHLRIPPSGGQHQSGALSHLLAKHIEILHPLGREKVLLLQLDQE